MRSQQLVQISRREHASSLVEQLLTGDHASRLHLIDVHRCSYYCSNLLPRCPVISKAYSRINRHICNAFLVVKCLLSVYEQEVVLEVFP